MWFEAEKSKSQGCFGMGEKALESSPEVCRRSLGSIPFPPVFQGSGCDRIAIGGVVKQGSQREAHPPGG